MKTATITDIFEDGSVWFKKGGEQFQLLRDLGTELEEVAMLPRGWELPHMSYGLYRVVGEDLWLAVEFSSDRGERACWLDALPGRGRSLF